MSETLPMEILTKFLKETKRFFFHYWVLKYRNWDIIRRSFLGFLYCFPGIQQTCYEDEYPLCIGLGEIFPHTEDSGSKLTSDRESVLGVVLLLFLIFSSLHDIPVYSTRLDSRAQRYVELSRHNALVFETRDSLALIFDHSISPL